MVGKSDGLFSPDGFALIQASVSIGRDVLIGPHDKIWSSDHKFSKSYIPIQRQGHDFAKVTIEDDVWSGAGTIVLKGAKIGSGVVVGA